MRQEVALSKPDQANHPYPAALLDMLPEMLQDPILIHESWTEKNSFVALLDAKDQGENLVAALHFRKTKNGIEITQVASVYPRQNPKILQAFRRTAAGAVGKITYYHKAKTRDWLNQNSGSNSPQYWIDHLGRGKNIHTDADVVKPEGGSLMSSPSQPGFSFDQTTDAGDKRQQGLDFTTSQATPAAPGRFRPKTLVEFAKPYRGPSGAVLQAYEWKHTLQATPISPPSGPSQRLFQETPAESKFLAAVLVLNQHQAIPADFVFAFLVFGKLGGDEPVSFFWFEIPTDHIPEIRRHETFHNVAWTDLESCLVRACLGNSFGSLIEVEPLLAGVARVGGLVEGELAGGGGGE
jgi:hypothetical protein